MPGAMANVVEVHGGENSHGDEFEPHIPARSVIGYLPLDRALTSLQRTGNHTAFFNSSIGSRIVPPSKHYLDIENFVQVSLNKMLNSKELTRVLNANTHPKLFPSWIMMSPNATLLAYSGHPNIKHLRDQSALLSQIWKEYASKFAIEQRKSSTGLSQLANSASSESSIIDGALETLTIESAKSNIIIRAVQPRLLLVLIGGPPPNRTSQFFKITPEARGDPRYPVEPAPSTNDTAEEHSADSSDPPAELLTQADDETMTGGTGRQELHELTEEEKLGLLHLQRKKIDAATEFMRRDFLDKDFTMPDESSIP